ncbi:MAG: hypothetical protein IT384_18950 [Deltaproteobacteria bacterium]|nr:hypothetical protein [Deltaproteobacteria bacterium]
MPVRINGVPLVFAWHPDEPLDTSFIEPEAVMRLGLTRQVMSGTIAHARPLRVKPDLVEPFSARVEQVEIDGRSTGPVWLGVAQFALVFLGADGQLGRDLIEGLGLALTREGQLRYLNCEGP